MIIAVLALEVERSLAVARTCHGGTILPRGRSTASVVAGWLTHLTPGRVGPIAERRGLAALHSRGLTRGAPARGMRLTPSAEGS